MDQYDNKDVVSQFGIMDPELEKVRTRTLLDESMLYTYRTLLTE